ncbi:MAG TPA: glycosyltransferase family 4 protein [Pseudomonadales bacterium]|nr:glycosyltransferase family 4 protein [Pseudomonadales bacterium]
MRIALALHRWFPFGGLQRDLLRTARRCVQAGHEVRVFAQSWAGPRAPEVPVVLLPVSGASNHVRARRFAERLGATLAGAEGGAFDAVVGFDRLPGLDLHFAADPCFVARAFESRGPLYRFTPRYRTFAALERAVFERGGRSRILLIDPRQQRVFTEWHGTEAERFIAVPPGVDRDRAPGADAPTLRARVRAEFAIAPGQDLLLLLGSDFRRKGVDRALRALAALPSGPRAPHLLVVGEDEPGALRALAQRLGIGGRVHFETGRDDVPALLQAADLLIHPARTENTGTVLVEALVAGLPVLCSAACGYAHHVAAAAAGEVIAEPFRQEALDAALAGLLDADRATLRARALAYAARTDLHAMHDHILAAIETVAATRVGGGA